jgi:hypothetical protein
VDSPFDDQSCWLERRTEIASNDSHFRLKSHVGYSMVHSDVSCEGSECHLPVRFTENEGEVHEEFTNDSIE